ncbi:FtsX-like permease family protein [Streptomyces sp. NPDC099050]|uniref:FtsX-like permease family protein n=1 Tax=Streptomyces sp. NPDC099050 TaxID=3366100 RepID=UPI003811B080
MIQRRRLQLALAWRVIIGRGRRRAMLLSLFAVPVLLAAFAAGSLQWITATADQRATNQMGSAAALIMPGETRPTADQIAGIIRPAGPGLTATEMIDSLEYPMVFDGITTLVSFKETDWSHGPARSAVRILSGTLPTAVGEVAITENLAARQKLALGDVMASRWSPATARITGIIQNPQGYLGQMIVAAPGQSALWKDAQHADEYGTQASWLLATSDPGQLSTVLGAAGDAGVLIRTRADIQASRSMLEREPGIIMIPGVLLVSVGAAAAFSIRMRRLQQEFALLSAVGLDSRWVLATCRIAGLTAAVWGATVGYLTGTTLSILVRPLLVSVVDKDLAPLTVPWQRGLALLVVSAVCAVVAVWWPTRLSQRKPVKRQIEAPTRYSLSWRLAVGSVFGGLAAAALATSVLLTSRSTSSLLATAGTAGLFLILLSSVPASLRLLAHLATPATATLRIALRNLAREPRRPVAAVAIGIFAVASTTATMVILASGAQDEKTSYVGPRHLGQIEVILRHTEAVTPISQALAAEFGPSTTVVPVKDVTAAPAQTTPTAASPLSAPPWQIKVNGPRISIGSSGMEYGDRPLGAVDTPEEFRAVTGRAPTDTEWRVIDKDGLLVLHPAYQQDGLATVAIPGADPAQPEQQVRVNRIALAAETDATTLGRVGALMASRTAQKLGATVTTNSIMVTPGGIPPAETTARLARVLEPLGVPITDVRIERGPSGMVPTKWYLVLSLGSVAAAISIILALSASAQELRPDLRRLFEMGFPPTARRRIIAWQSITIALLSTICGVIAGLAISTSRLVPYDIEVAVPWTQLTAWILAPILLSIALSPLLAPNGRQLRTGQ